MIVVTTPTGQIGQQLVKRLLAAGESVRVIARDVSRLDAGARSRLEVVEGSHADPDVLDQALRDADGYFLLVPPDFGAEDTESRYVDYARVAIDAVQAHDVSHVVGVSSAGHGWPDDAGLLSSAFAMDVEFERSGISYRALSMPWFMENLFNQLDPIRDQGSFTMAYDADRVLPSIATEDIAAAAAGLLVDLSWIGYENVPVIGPDRLTPTDMASVMSEVLGRPVTYTALAADDLANGMKARGASDGLAADMAAMMTAQNAGIYDADVAASVPTATSFRAWCERVLEPAVLSSV